MSDAMQAGWDAAVDACMHGHGDDCTYGGMTPRTGYWLAAEGCELNHGSTCAWCPAEATTGFAGWGDDGWSLWQVPACEEHGAAWASGHPEWTRGTEPKPEPSWQGLLDGLSPSARVLAEDYRRRMDDALLYGNGPRPEEPGFDGIGALMKGVLAGPVAPDGPPWTHTVRLPEPAEDGIEQVSRLVVGVGDDEPFEVDGEFRFAWKPADGALTELPGGVLRVDPMEVSFEASPEVLGWFVGLAARLPEMRELQAARHRRAWSGPDRLERLLLRAFRVTARDIGLVRRSVLDEGYRRRQRARVKRKR